MNHAGRYALCFVNGVDTRHTQVVRSIAPCVQLVVHACAKFDTGFVLDFRFGVDRCCDHRPRRTLRDSDARERTVLWAIGALVSAQPIDFRAHLTPHNRCWITDAYPLEQTYLEYFFVSRRLVCRVGHQANPVTGISLLGPVFGPLHCDPPPRPR